MYTWPNEELDAMKGWDQSAIPGFLERQMPEKKEELARDSRWPGFFPSAICFVTTTNGKQTALEKVVGATIVNRFPYIVAISLCTKPLSERHYVREKFMEVLEAGRSVAIQFFAPGPCIDQVMEAINSVEDARCEERIAHTGLKTRPAQTSSCPVFEQAYLVYEAKLVKPGKDFEGNEIFEKPYTDCGSHRIYYLEINAIQLRRDIAHGQSQINWQSLPFWKTQRALQEQVVKVGGFPDGTKYQKGYTSNYFFPAKNTIGFEYDKVENGMAIKFLPPLPDDQVEIDNDKARWPCFFPSSVGMITTWGENNTPNLMPCGSTTVLVRFPLSIGICVSYARLNVRYAPRASLKSLLEKEKFVCGVPYDHDLIIDAIKYAGNVSVVEDMHKITNAGLQYVKDEFGPILPALPICYRCKITEVVRLGTHFLLIGQVASILVREDVTQENSLKWTPYPNVTRQEEDERITKVC